MAVLAVLVFCHWIDLNSCNTTCIHQISLLHRSGNVGRHFKVALNETLCLATEWTFESKWQLLDSVLAGFEQCQPFSDVVWRRVVPHVIIGVEIDFYSPVSRWRQMTHGSSSNPHRRMRPTRTLITCLSCWSLVTAAWGKPPFCSATQMTPSPRPSSAPWASTLRSRLSSVMTRGSSCRFGWVDQRCFCFLNFLSNAWSLHCHL